MKAKITLLFLLSLTLFACEQSITRKGGLYTPVINPNNFREAHFRLPAYGFQIFVISNHTEALADTNRGWWKDAIVYQVYPRSFYDSNKDGYGDLPGLIEKLDYISNLGCTAIWTLPIIKSLNDGSVGRALGYEATDYYNINPVYGNMADFEHYVSSAHKHKINVILDMVINHTSRTHPWFLASEKRDQKYKDWYVWTNANINALSKAGWKKPWGGGSAWDVWHYNKKRKEFFYATWGAELNFKNPAVRKEGIKIARFWLNKGANGFRLDAFRYLIEDGPGKGQADSPSTLNYVKEYQAALKKYNKNIYTVAEIWSADYNVKKYELDGHGFDAAFSFDFQSHIKNSLVSGKARDLYYYIKYGNKNNPDPFFLAPFLDNHDMDRLIKSFPNNYTEAKLAAAVLLTFRGTPFIYYGDEIGMTAQQNPMQWNDSPYAGFSTHRPWMLIGRHQDPRNVKYQMENKDSLWWTYKRLIAFRKNSPALRRGRMQTIRSDNPAILSYLRPGTNVTVLFVANFSKNTQSFSLDFKKSGLKPGDTYHLTPLDL